MFLEPDYLQKFTFINKEKVRILCGLDVEFNEDGSAFLIVYVTDFELQLAILELRFSYNMMIGSFDCDDLVGGSALVVVTGQINMLLKQTFICPIMSRNQLWMWSLQGGGASLRPPSIIDGKPSQLVTTYQTVGIWSGRQTLPRAAFPLGHIY